MADFSNSKISLTLFEHKEEDRKSDKSPTRSGFVEITLADLDEFFSLCKNIEPELNFNKEQAIKLRIALWDREGKESKKPYRRALISPERNTRFKMEPEELVKRKQPDPTPVTPTEIVFDENERI